MFSVSPSKNEKKVVDIYIEEEEAPVIINNIAEVTVTAKKIITPKGSFAQKYTDDDVPLGSRYPQGSIATPFGRKVDNSSFSAQNKASFVQSQNAYYKEGNIKASMVSAKFSRKSSNNGGFTTTFQDESMPEERPKKILDNDIK